MVSFWTCCWRRVRGYLVEDTERSREGDKTTRRQSRSTSLVRSTLGEAMTRMTVPIVRAWSWLMVLLNCPPSFGDVGWWWDLNPVQARISQLGASVFAACQTLQCSYIPRVPRTGFFGMRTIPLKRRTGVGVLLRCWRLGRG